MAHMTTHTSANKNQSSSMGTKRGRDAPQVQTDSEGPPKPPRFGGLLKLRFLKWRKVTKGPVLQS